MFSAALEWASQTWIRSPSVPTDGLALRNSGRSRVYMTLFPREMGGSCAHAFAWNHLAHTQPGTTFPRTFALRRKLVISSYQRNMKGKCGLTSGLWGLRSVPSSCSLSLPPSTQTIISLKDGIMG